jgi:hypothetical protein
MVAWNGIGILQFGCCELELCRLGYLNYSAAARECTTVNGTRHTDTDRHLPPSLLLVLVEVHAYI